MNFETIVENLPYIAKRKLEQLKFLRERPDYHPEKSVYEHIRIVTERLLITGNYILVCAGIFHDICKFDTVRENIKTGWPTSPGHDNAARDLILNNTSVQAFITDLCGTPDAVAMVAQICEEHMRVKLIDEMKLSKQTTIRNLPVFSFLEIFTLADDMITHSEDVVRRMIFEKYLQSKQIF